MVPLLNTAPITKFLPNMDGLHELRPSVVLSKFLAYRVFLWVPVYCLMRAC